MRTSQRKSDKQRTGRRGVAVQVWLPETLIERVNAHRAKRFFQIGMQPTMTDIVRVGLTEWLDRHA